ncbi:MAG: T9SS type A sorting domain-containing protein [Candidatus Goldbacteria bacterium]|nr:T9SS type A sorting domain-containing protein [Candidatus Goldiibacteriota bacterium]
MIQLLFLLCVSVAIPVYVKAEPVLLGNRYISEDTNRYVSLNSSTKRLSYRFTAAFNMTTSSLWIYCGTKLGSAGYEIGIQTDSNSYPSGIYLNGSTTTSLNDNSWNQVSITTVSLTKGQIYHIVIRSSDATSLNYNNFAYSFPNHKLFPKNQEYDGNAQVLEYNGTWQPANYGEGGMPIFIIDESGTTEFGNPYMSPYYYSIHAGGTNGEPGDDSVAGEEIIWNGPATSITGVEFYVRRYGNPGEPLNYRIVNITDSEVIYEDVLANSFNVSTVYTWKRALFNPVIFETGKTYRVYLYANGPSSSLNEYEVLTNSCYPRAENLFLSQTFGGAQNRFIIDSNGGDSFTFYDDTDLVYSFVQGDAGCVQGTFGKTTKGFSTPWASDGTSLNSTKYKMGVTGTVNTINLNVAAMSVNTGIRVALYSNNTSLNGGLGGPENLLTQSVLYNAVLGWNAVPVPEVNIMPGDYWLAFQAESGIEIDNNYSIGSGSEGYRTGYTFGDFPAVFAASNYDDTQWSIYAQYCEGEAPTPTPTPPVILSNVSSVETMEKVFFTNASYQLSYKFKAPYDIQAQSIRLTGYKGGATSTFIVGIKADDGFGKPLAGYLTNSTPTAAANYWNTFEIPAYTLNAGNIYHIVVEASVLQTGGYQFSYTTPNHHVFPLNQYYDADADVLFFNGTSWASYNGMPVFEIEDTGGKHFGNPYDYSGFSAYIHGNNSAVTSDDKIYGEDISNLTADTVTNEVVCYLRKAGNPTDPVFYTIKNITDGFDEASGILAYPADVTGTYQWKTAGFPAFTLIAGKTYRLIFHSQNTGTGSADYYEINMPDNYSVVADVMHTGLNYQGLNQKAVSSENGGTTWIVENEADIVFKLQYNPVPTEVPTATETFTQLITPTFTPTVYACSDMQFFGACSTGLVDVDLNGAYIAASRYQLHEDGFINELSAYIYSSSGGTIRLALYSDSAGAPGSLLFQGAPQTCAAGWNSTNLNTQYSLQKGYYWIAVQLSDAGDSMLNFDTSMNVPGYVSAFSEGPFPAVFPAGTSNTNGYTVKASYCPQHKWVGYKSPAENGRLSRLDASGERIAMRFTQPESKIITSVYTYVNAVSASPQYKVGIQAAAGDVPSGTYLTSGLITPSAAGWIACPVTNYTLNPGDYFVVIEPSGNPNGSKYSEWKEGNTPGWRIWPTDNFYDSKFLAFSNLGLGWNPDSTHPLMTLKYSDGTVRGNPYQENIALAVHNNNTAGDVSDDRFAMQVFVPGPNGWKVDKIGAFVYASTTAPGGTLDYYIYDEAAKVTMTSGVLAGTSNAPVAISGTWIEADLAAQYILEEGKIYKVFFCSHDSPSTNRWHVLAGQTLSGSADMQKATFQGEAGYAGFSTNNNISYTNFLNYDALVRLRYIGPAAAPTFTFTPTQTTTLTNTITITVTVTPINTVDTGWVDADGTARESEKIEINAGVSYTMPRSLAVDNNGYYHVAWRDDTPGNTDIFYKYWNGTAWNIRGNINVSNTVDPSNIPALAVDGTGTPYIAWQEGALPSEIYCYYWNGLAWQGLGGGNVSNNAGNSGYPSIVTDNSGYPIIFWTDDNDGDYDIYMKRWNGSSWGTAVNISNDTVQSQYPSAAFDKNTGNIHVVYESNTGGFMEVYHAFYNGSVWSTPINISNTPPYDSLKPSLAVDNFGRPHAAWQEDNGTYYQINYLWFNGSAWVDVDGSGVESVVAASYGGECITPSLVVEPSGRPHISFVCNDTGNFEVNYIKRFNTAWVDADGSGIESRNISQNVPHSYSPSLALRADMRPVAVWAQQGSPEDVSLLQYEGPLGATESGGCIISLDTAFNNAGATPGIVTHDNAAGGFGSDTAYGIEIQSDSIYAAGASYNGTNIDMAVWKYKADGLIDTSFNPGFGYSTHDNAAGGSDADYGRAVALDSGGRVFVAGYSMAAAGNDMALWCYTPGGILDTTFNNSGAIPGIVTHHNAAGGNSADAAYGAAVDSGGRIIVVGYSYNASYNGDMVIWRYNPDGTLDTSFNSGGAIPGIVVHHNAAGGNSSDQAFAVTIDINNKIVVAGYSYNAAGNADLAIWRYNTNGTLDTSFNPGGAIPGIVTLDGPGIGTDYGYSIVTDGVGNVYVAGMTDVLPDASINYDMIVWKYLNNGSLDNSFNSASPLPGIFTHGSAAGGIGNDYGAGIKLDASGRVVVTGYGTNGTDNDMIIWRLTTLGVLDTDFDDDGIVISGNAAGGSGNDHGMNLVISADGSILVAGESRNSSLNNDMTLWRYKDSCSAAGVGTPTDTPTLKPSFTVTPTVTQTLTATATSTNSPVINTTRYYLWDSSDNIGYLEDLKPDTPVGPPMLKFAPVINCGGPSILGEWVSEPLYYNSLPDQDWAIELWGYASTAGNVQYNIDVYEHNGISPVNFIFPMNIFPVNQGAISSHYINFNPGFSYAFTPGNRIMIRISAQDLCISDADVWVNYNDIGNASYIEIPLDENAAVSPTVTQTVTVTYTLTGTQTISPSLTATQTVTQTPCLDLPSSVVAFPQDGQSYDTINQISGTAYAVCGLVTKVEIALRRLSDGYFWNGASWADTPASAGLAAGTDNWTFDALPVWQPGENYLLMSTATDSLSNVESGITTAFSINLPTATATQTVTVTGTATRTTTQTVTETITESATRTVTQTATQTATETVTETITHTSTETITESTTQTATETSTETSTPTSTETATQTVTETMTKTNTQTSTETVTRTVTQTVTETITHTSTGTVTESVTQTATETSTETSTPTLTETVTQTATETVTQTATPSNTATQTATESSTQTATETITETTTETATQSATQTVTETVTQTATQTITETSTNTPDDTQTITPTSTVTFTNTVTETVSRTVTETSTETTTQTITETVTATVTETLTETVTETVTVTVTATVTETATNTVTETATETATETVTKTSTETATETVTETVTETNTGTITQTHTNTPPNTHTITTTITVTGTPTSTNTVSETVTKTVTETATESVTATITESITETTTKTSTETATETSTPTSTATATGTSTLTVTQTSTPTATTTSTITYTGTDTPTATATPTLTLTDTATSTATATMTATQSVTLTATLSNTPTSTITLTSTESTTPTTTNTATETNTPSVTQTNTQTNTATSTSTDTATDTNTPTPSETFTDTATYTYTETPTETSTYTYTPTETFTNTATDTFTSTNTFTETYTPTITPTFTNTPTPNIDTALDRNYVEPLKGDKVKVSVKSQTAGELIEVKVYNLSGERVRQFNFYSTGAGWNEGFWDCRNDAGKTVGQGLYFMRIKQNNTVQTKRVFIIK